MSQQLEKFIPIVEGGIQSLGVDPASIRGQVFGEWYLQRGSATVLVKINTVNAYNGVKDILVILTAIASVPARNQEVLFRKLLEENHKLLNERFTIFNDQICLVSSRDMQGMDAQEVHSMIDGQSYAADLLDDKVREFVAANA
ncbi:MAG: YbjN domain-containing protein [Cytophagaceae bacterium]|jgi:hypothetical protein|nr:YbjN domain-containing protein [Cytophagaceae bacterium]